MKWISEQDALPVVGEEVFFAAPRQGRNFWRIAVARLLIRYEEVWPVPVKAGSRWPVDYWWSVDHLDREPHLVTGNGWWASFEDIPLPPGAEHFQDRGNHYIVQAANCLFVPQGKS